MKTVTVHVYCTICQQFDRIIEIDTNEYGFFVMPDSAYCPNCFGPLHWVVHAEHVRDIDAGNNTTE